jgi:RNA polymerase sigma-70 factor (ECF subfamily)
MSRDFRKLADEYSGRVYTYALYSLRRREDAEDVTQEVLVRLWQHRDGIRPDLVGPWVMRVARNLVVDFARRGRARATMFADGPAAELAAAMVASGDTVAGNVERGDLRSSIEAAIAELDEPYRSIVVMREIQELAYQEIASALDLPLGTVKVYLHRARRRLRESVRREMEINE